MSIISAFQPPNYYTRGLLGLVGRAGKLCQALSLHKDGEQVWAFQSSDLLRAQSFFICVFLSPYFESRSFLLGYLELLPRKGDCIAYVSAITHL